MNREEARAKLDMEIEKSLFIFTNKIKENIYDFIMMSVKRDQVLNQSIDDKTLKTIISLAQTCVQQGKGLFIDEFNGQIKKALDDYTGAENPTLMALTEIPKKEMLVQTNLPAISQPLPQVTKPKVSFVLPQD